MSANNPQSDPIGWSTYLWSAYKQYFFHFREPFTQKKLAILKIPTRWAWYSHFISFAVSLPLLFMVFNLSHPVASILTFAVIVSIIQPFLAAVISLLVVSICRLNHARSPSA